MTTKPELKPCPFCGNTPKVTNSEHADGYKTRLIKCFACEISPGILAVSRFEDQIKLDADGRWNTRAETPPAATVADDAISAIGKVCTEVTGVTWADEWSREALALLEANGFTITRAAAPMTDAELERELVKLSSKHFADIPDGCIADIMALAKKYRG